MKTGYKYWLNVVILPSISKRLSPPRFFSLAEWKKFNDKEKIWISYKHWMKMKGQGDGEIGIIESIAFNLIGAWTVLSLNHLTHWLMVLAPVWIASTWYLKFKFGDYKDSKDLITLETEIDTRRNRAFRKIMKTGAKK